ncbi:hypothetical protein [Halobacillus massiliensis]|uniref:hypothetical protein n=1 Tax=Halobacillus massiliensis TaxID=1926286 RepID=UPI0009E3E6DE|nr:hypothetical protein [Halobacillus massiliensis]
MTEVFDFRSYKSRKNLKQMSQKNRVYEIYLTTVKYILKHRSSEYNPPGDYLSTTADLNEIFAGNGNLFAKTFSELTEYWNIQINPAKDYPMGKEFEHFPTVGHLCSFIEKNLPG